MIKRIVIVGGGSAGWLVAGMVAAEHQASSVFGLQVTLIEAPDIASIGVGEGTWPTMRDTLRRIGVSEADFIRECDASFKQGSRFYGWVSGEASDNYYHPFMQPHGYGDVNLVAGWQQFFPHNSFAHAVSVQSHLCDQGKAPKQALTPEFAAVTNYGYHLDAMKLTHFLRKHCVGKLGVIHIQDQVVSVHSNVNGDIASLQTKQNGAIEGDLFIDCTGMQSLLLGQHYHVKFLTQKHVLFNDSALAVQIPYADKDTPIISYTNSTAQNSGWIWDIGLQSRRGVGYVYSGAHTTDEKAEFELRTFIEKNGGSAEMAMSRKLSFNPGYREKFWHRNCLAIGLSAGFIEPLEASALALVELSATMLCEEMPVTREAMEVASKRFNKAFIYRWERVIDFLKLHYVLSRRDTDYWRENRLVNTIPDQLNELLLLWRHQPPSRYDLPLKDEVFPSASYQYVLYGMGFYTNLKNGTKLSDSPDLAFDHLRETAELSTKMLAALPTNRELIAHIKHHGLHTI